MTVAKAASKRIKRVIAEFRKAGCTLKQVFAERGWGRIAIYGGSILGVALYEEFTAEGLSVECIIDKNAVIKFPYRVEILHPDGLRGTNRFDVIVVSALASRNEVMSFLGGLRLSASHIDVDDLLELLLETGDSESMENVGEAARARSMEYMVLAQLERINQKMNMINGKVDALEKKCQAVLFNQFSLMNPGDGAREFHAPGRERESFPLYRTDDGNWCFTLPDGRSRKTNRILVVSIPKSGTHFISKVIVELGYRRIKIFALDDYFADIRSTAGAPGHVIIATGEKWLASLPLHIASQFVLPGQVLHSHLIRNESLRHAGWNGAVLGMVRDLRCTVISYARHNNKFYSSLALSKDAIADWIRNSNVVTWYSGFMKSAIDMPPETLPVRFEELISPTLDNTSIQSIATAAQCSPEEALAAVDKARGAETLTWTGKITNLEEWWSDEIEEAFVARGFDVMNEQLGYPRRYSPETYPGGLPTMVKT